MNKRNKTRTAEGKSRLEILVKKYGNIVAASMTGLSKATVNAILRGSSGVGVVAMDKIDTALGKVYESDKAVAKAMTFTATFDAPEKAPPSPVDVILGWRKDSETLAKIKALLS